VYGVTACYGILTAVFREFEEGGSIHNRIFVTVIEKKWKKKRVVTRQTVTST